MNSVVHVMVCCMYIHKVVKIYSQRGNLILFEKFWFRDRIGSNYRSFVVSQPKVTCGYG